MSDVQSALFWLVLLSIFTIAMSISVCVVIYHFNQRLVKLESRDFNKDLRMVWDKIRANDAENTLRDHRIIKLESEEYFGDIEEEGREQDITDVLENAARYGNFLHNGILYRVTPDKNEG
jgi:hypothetical protein